MKQQAGFQLSDIDVIELIEAIALGHLIGATGTILMTKLIYELQLKIRGTI
ncbi:hypothetical protein ACIQ4I_02155 [Rummeliibacillus sp. NPDC094406]|uniref:hypothetical protein n=1 Tax=Rummeliibacillus sp. NPDC094406 TaxID=3364511 RepID=UPI0037F1D767